MALDHSTPTAPALEIRSLDKAYGAVPVLHRIDIEMAQGEFLVLVGPSGCGKSTLLNCIAGLEEITAGTLRIAGRDVTQEPPADRDIAMVFQSYALYPTMTVGENIGFGMKIRRVPKDRAQARVAEVARMLQIDHLLDRRPGQLSGGQRQRVAMGRALVRDPALFLFDEPLSNLDAKLRVEMRAEIKRLHRTTGASIVYVTHDQVEAMTLASRIVVLKGGHVQQIGTPQQIYDTPANTFVADFMGSPPMNLCPAEIEDGAIRVGDQRIALPAGFGPDLPREVILGIRPEHLSLGAAPDLTVQPVMIENTGSECYLSFQLGGHAMTAKLPGRMDEDRLEPVGLVLDHDRISLFDPQTTRRIPR
ncbi:sn-glycerol-3-phosphate ABC transporter ATP-binding protein UgpC [Paracoccus aestuarii]|uniref:sn-glycerol-3-phosphate ABC transporter ATP-binding protein UgpC n=1 Tax=Paracoccus aestuarii TaxID=453842 RepID=A0A419A1J1_9RHOB|nr:sn-glycerol-3-phosphate ABC transporter ATP-binding protein UgpC [Paracoccus aestuarii]RJL06893.1 sn-glycerol-3-phosphate ABC transporter ATP-binding protein UgpC [Paracoccus aestuarii]WCQ99784.1 sn-glycerol-3-phosphate ABC transporter ATP-binding protein UgpC [Paracoccus aestuarii]